MRGFGPTVGQLGEERALFAGLELASASGTHDVYGGSGGTFWCMRGNCFSCRVRGDVRIVFEGATPVAVVLRGRDSDGCCHSFQGTARLVPTG